MIREIIIPKERDYLLSFPAEMVGKRVEIIAFNIDEIRDAALPNGENDIEGVEAIFRDCKVDLSGYKFDRDKANDYDE